MKKSDLYSLLCDVGFQAQSSPLFLVDAVSDVSGAYLCNILRSSKKAHFGGAVGLYFREFEEEWIGSLTPAEKKLDSTLPLVMLIDNYIELVDADVFRFEPAVEELVGPAKAIYNLCSSMPNSQESFTWSLQNCSLLGKPISQYIHIRPQFENENLYYRKSVSFLQWLHSANPCAASRLDRCLMPWQRQKTRR